MPEPTIDALRFEQLERERDELEAELRRAREGWTGWQQQALAAEAKLAAYEEALREIAKERYGCMPDGRTPSAFARATLASQEARDSDPEVRP